jgi:catechol 2,3-dioxygenase-like lactoylglutathione lyase family enzyme
MKKSLALKDSPALLITPLALLIALACGTLSNAQQPLRPKILGIARVHFAVSNIGSARGFYQGILGQLHDCNWCDQPQTSNFLVGTSQAIVLSSGATPDVANLLQEVTFATDDVPALRRYLQAHEVKVAEPANKKDDTYFFVLDPEGHRIGFTAHQANDSGTQPVSSPSPDAFHIIHAGFIVRDRDAEDRFYRDILGFHVYWHGGMTDSQTDWVDMQVPDGTDWLEYMLNVSPKPDQHLRGVMNHVALGVSDLKPVVKRLRKDNFLPIFEQPHIGRDGKWQLNLYDLDLTRVEIMELTPTQKPCCSDYAGPHPKP